MLYIALQLVTKELLCTMTVACVGADVSPPMRWQVDSETRGNWTKDY